jgi:predicted nucleotidyltransferase/predicted transcriptional regulator with HTH domain
MDVLAKLVSSKARARVLASLFGLFEKELYLREITRHTDLAIGSVQQEIENLKELELIVSRKDGNRLYYRANKNHPLYSEIHNIVTKTTGLVPMISNALTNEKIHFAFVFGSVARGKEKAGSDIDIVVVGDLGLRKLSGLLAEVSEKLDREINHHIFRPEEFVKRIESKDHFVTSILQEPKVFIVGNEDELRSMAQKRLD